MATSAIIVAAGGSRRMGFDKLNANLCGQSVLERSIRTFAQCEVVDEIIIVANPERQAFIDSLSIDKIYAVVSGGSERHLSVWNGIQVVSDSADLIAVHDGARPLVTTEAISECCQVAREHGAATLAHRIVDTLKRAQPGSHEVSESVDREDLWAMETPQVFRRDLLVSAYENIIKNQNLVTDEVSAIQQQGIAVQLVENLTANIKITVPGDLDIAAAILAKQV